jgi:transcriptional regulator with XRE-family HTH domain
MADKRLKLADQLRQAIDDCGLTRYAIAKRTGIDESALAKFYNGHRGHSMEALNALGEFLELRITLWPDAAEPRAGRRAALRPCQGRDDKESQSGPSVYPARHGRPVTSACGEQDADRSSV